jgi:hypothetical protein
MVVLGMVRDGSTSVRDANRLALAERSRARNFNRARLWQSLLLS